MLREMKRLETEEEEKKGEGIPQNLAVMMRC